MKHPQFPIKLESFPKRGNGYHHAGEFLLRATTLLRGQETGDAFQQERGAMEMARTGINGKVRHAATL